jgi:hypothetical protein
MPFVIDASVAASWLLPDETDARAEQAYALLDTDSAVVPGLWWFELRNVFIVNERRGRMNQVPSGCWRACRYSSIVPSRKPPCSRSRGAIASRSMMPPISSWRSAKVCLLQRSMRGSREQHGRKRWF